VQPAWATPHTCVSRRTNPQHKAPKTHLNQTAVPSKIIKNHTNETMKLDEGWTRTNFLCTVRVFPCSYISVACLSWCWNSVSLVRIHSQQKGKIEAPWGWYCRRRIPAAAGDADATPSGVSRVRVTRTVLRECDIGLHRTVTVDSHRRRMDTRI